MPAKSYEDDWITRLYRSLYNANNIEDLPFEDLVQDLESEGVNTDEFFKKVQTLRKNKKWELLCSEANSRRLKFAEKIAERLRIVKASLPQNYAEVLKQLQSAFGHGQAEMALRNYGVTEEADVKSLLEDLKALEELEGDNDKN